MSEFNNLKKEKISNGVKSIFDRYYKKYDTWYEKNKFAYLSELGAIKKVLPKVGKGLEIGVGTGRFAAPLNIVVLGIVDKNSFLGKHYQSKESVFYKQANFFNVKELTDLLKATGFNRFSYYQTVFKFPDKIDSIEKPRRGFGEGGFVVISALKRCNLRATSSPAPEKREGGRSIRYY